MTINVNARAASQNINSGETLPSHVQWMPPGRQTVQPVGFESPFEMEVTPELARLADAQLQQLRNAAATGKDVEPYFDFNHKDEGRAFKPTRFFWAGSDPKTGGIRAEGTWTGAGAKAVLDGELCCISASWMLNKTTKEFLGINHNVGGLVTRSAFHSIQAFAKAGSQAADSQTPAEIFMAEAKAHGAARGITDEIDAQTAYAHTPAGRIAYANLIGHPVPGETPVQAAHASAAAKSGEHPFMVKAKAYAVANKITDELDAISAFARTAEGCGLYNQYCDAIAPRR